MSLPTVSIQILPPAVVGVLHANGLAFDVAKFNGLSAEGHVQAGFHAFKTSVLAAVLAGAHFSAAVELIRQGKREALEANLKIPPSPPFTKGGDDAQGVEGSESLLVATLRLNPYEYINQEAQRRGIDKSTIYRMIDVYTLFTRSPASCLDAFAQLDYSKLLELKKFDDTALQALGEGGTAQGLTLELLKNGSVREVKAALKQHKAALLSETEVDVKVPKPYSFQRTKKQIQKEEQIIMDALGRCQDIYRAHRHIQQEGKPICIREIIKPLLAVSQTAYGMGMVILMEAERDFGLPQDGQYTTE